MKIFQKIIPWSKCVPLLHMTERSHLSSEIKSSEYRFDHTTESYSFYSGFHSDSDTQLSIGVPEIVWGKCLEACPPPLLLFTMNMNWHLSICPFYWMGHMQWGKGVQDNWTYHRRRVHLGWCHRLHSTRFNKHSFFENGWGQVECVTQI